VFTSTALRFSEITKSIFITALIGIMFVASFIYHLIAMIFSRVSFPRDFVYVLPTNRGIRRQNADVTTRPLKEKQQGSRSDGLHKLCSIYVEVD
jgi:hypothetical protein